MGFRITVDTGGTFTDVVAADANGRMTLAKSLTTPERIFHGMGEALTLAARQLSLTLPELLAATDLFIYGTTRATNAIVTGKVGRTALLLTAGFPDILVLKEGGKFHAHDFSQDFPEPYIRRSDTFEIVERIDAEGTVRVPLDEGQALDVLEAVARRGFEAVAVCFLWATANPAHEARLGALIEQRLPGVSYTLSHRLLPVVREYRRASAAAIDASLKPLMQAHLREMAEDLQSQGYSGELLVATGLGGCQHVPELIERPIHAVGSGPAMAPVAGAAYAAAEDRGEDVIVCDTGGTTFDVSLVRAGTPNHTRETWLGGQWTGHLVAMSSVDVRSVGAGGGSIAWVDPGGLLRVGPQSAGARPGPACYALGGTEPTVTDAALVLKYLDPEFFLGGRMRLDRAAARRAVEQVARPLGRGVEAAAFAILTLASELMIKAIQEITVAQGFDPREAVLVAGGGAAGLNIVPIARELGCARVILPRTAAALSACGMQFSHIVAEETASLVTLSDRFDFSGVNAALDRIEATLQGFLGRLGRATPTHRLELFAEARYQAQVWELDVPLPGRRFRDAGDVAALHQAFDRVHERTFAMVDPGSRLECINWKGRLTASLPTAPWLTLPLAASPTPGPVARRPAYFGADAPVSSEVHRGDGLAPGASLRGPAIIEEATTTIVLPPGARATLSASGNYVIEVGA
ncbi:MAG: hydantoinase/oxoprolinase family protein [Alphaproteobacteria bacterium]|nr:hydantoinase/oxoprolinase family protein [Alphaproteobacteria bacterium]